VAFSLVMHGSYTTEYERSGHVAVCTCGWRSRPSGSAGIAGSMWDAHVDTAELPLAS
jgi:hypothetical protein